VAKSIDEIRTEAVEILRADYPHVKEGLYRLEVFMQSKSKKAVYELRDFLDHFAQLFRQDIGLAEAEKHLHECHTHLRRCAVEPLEYMAEKRFVQLDRYARWFSRIPFIFRGNPVTKPEFFQKMAEAKRLIAEGRVMKTEGQACQLMDQAFGIVTDLLAQVYPLRYLVQGLLWVFVTFVAGALSALAGVYLLRK